MSVIHGNIAVVLVYDYSYQPIYFLEKIDANWKVACTKVLYAGPLR
jgi:hypothetical protein